MIIANKLRSSNRAEYLLYMWQVEDILRAYQCNIDRIKSEYLTRFTLTPEQEKEVEEWYRNLCEMMISEGKREKGHLQINCNTLEGLIEINAQLLKSEKFPYYKSIYYRVLPYVIEIRAKGEKKEKNEIETCFDILYCTMLLRLQHKEISAETQKAVTDISTLLGQLSDYFLKNQKEAIDF